MLSDRTTATVRDADVLATAEGLVRTLGPAGAQEALTRLFGPDRAEQALARFTAQELVARRSSGRILSPCCPGARTATMRRARRRRPIIMPGTTPGRAPRD